MSNNNNVEVRIPRLKGSTNLAISCSHTQTPSNLYTHIIAHYLDNGFTYMGQRMSIEGLSELLNIPLEAITRAIIDSSGVYARIFNPENLEETLRALLGRALWGSLRDRATIQRFAEGLESQIANNQSIGMYQRLGYLYQKTLESLMGSNKTLISLITQVMPKAPTQNFFFPVAPQGQQAGDDSPLSIGQAVELLGQSASNPLLLGQATESKAAQLYEAQGLQDIEPIIANPGDEAFINPTSLITASEEFINDVAEVTGS